MQTENIAGKQLIFNADDFGMSEAFNKGVLLGFREGFLTSACICANGVAFDQAINEILPQCENMGLGVHLNIIEGKTIKKNPSRTAILYDSDGTYRHGFLSLLVNSANKRLLQEIEDDFRIQIEAVLNHTRADHLNSHVHTHGIPAIFEIVCKLAKEYNIPFVRTQSEKYYLAPSVAKHMHSWYIANIAKIIILNSCSVINFKTAKDYDININKYLIGVGYTGHMDSMAIESGLKAIKDKNCITEILIHPNWSDDPNDKSLRYTEFRTIQDKQLLEKIKLMGWELTNYSKLSFQN